ncbi:MAG: TIGR02757 family protein [Candidatus Brocadiia bacterium]
MRRELESLYEKYNSPRYAERDPVRFVHGYASEDAEIAGLVAALLAYGSLPQILDSVADALDRLGDSPRRTLIQASEDRLRTAADGFGHRFVDSAQFARLLNGLQHVLRRYGSLRECFLAHDDPDDETILAGLTGLAHELEDAGGGLDHLVADPAKGSVCKRWHLFMRWMVRSDAVDPGLWTDVSPGRLIVPLDTHMWQIARRFGFTERRSRDLPAALEVTEGFRAIRPDDPVRYDFALMHASASEDAALERCIEAAGN